MKIHHYQKFKAQIHVYVQTIHRVLVNAHHNAPKCQPFPPPTPLLYLDLIIFVFKPKVLLMSYYQQNNMKQALCDVDKCAVSLCCYCYIYVQELLTRVIFHTCNDLLSARTIFFVHTPYVWLCIYGHVSHSWFDCVICILFVSYLDLG